MVMLDELPLLQRIERPQEVRKGVLEPFYFNGLLFLPIMRSDDNGVFVCKYFHNKGNVRFVIQGDCLSIYNSWHKCLKGNNYTDYTYKDFINTIALFEDYLGLTLLEARILKASVSVNINLEAEKDFSTWLMFKRKAPQPMTKNGNVYGLKFQLNDYYLKGYNKTKEVVMNDKHKIEEDLYRIEVVGRRRMFMQQKIGCNTLNDLCNKNIWHQMKELLIEKYQAIVKLPLMDYHNLSIKDLGIIGIMSNNDLREHFKTCRERTFKNYLNRIKAIEQGQTPNDVVASIGDKMNYLINH